MSFVDKCVLVTGGSRGIGAAIAIAFRDQGARVAVGGRASNSFEQFVAKHGSHAVHPAIGDMGTRAGCTAAVGAALDALGGLDVLVNAAGVYSEVPVGDIGEAHWNEMIDVNLSGPFHCTQAALPALRKSRGNIVNIASESGMIGFRGAVAYCAAKGGVVNLTRALAIELVPDVRVNCVCPGNVDTDMMREAAERSADPDAYRRWMAAHAPLGRMAQPGEIAAAVLYLASDSAGFTTGAILAVDGGQTAGVAGAT